MGPKKDKVQHPQDKFEKDLKHSVETDVNGIAGSRRPQGFLFHPPLLYRGHGNLQINPYYCHDVLILAPHLQFPDVDIPCECGGRYVPSQWADRRKLHGTDQPVSLLQYRYKCNQCNHTLVAGELLKTEQCPDIVRLGSPKFYLTHNGGVTGQVLEMIMEGGVSKQSFDDIQMSISTMRKNRYLRLRLQYEVALNDFCTSKGVHIQDMTAFSAMDDKKGYNVSPTDPSSEYIIDVFKAKVAEFKGPMEGAFDDQCAARSRSPPLNTWIHCCSTGVLKCPLFLELDRVTHWGWRCRSVETRRGQHKRMAKCATVTKNTSRAH